MKREIPKGGRAERIAFARGWIRERRADEPGVRLSRGRRRLIGAGLYLLLLIPLGWLATSLRQSVLAWTLPDPEPWRENQGGK